MCRIIPVESTSIHHFIVINQLLDRCITSPVMITIRAIIDTIVDSTQRPVVFLCIKCSMRTLKDQFNCSSGITYGTLSAHGYRHIVCPSLYGRNRSRKAEFISLTFVHNSFCGIFGSLPSCCPVP